MALNYGWSISIYYSPYVQSKFLFVTSHWLCNWATFSNWELIVVDNYSTNNSKEIIESFYDERINYLKFSNNGIVAASRNFGIKRAKGRYLTFVDSDDWWVYKKLELSLIALENGAILYTMTFIMFLRYL